MRKLAGIAAVIAVCAASASAQQTIFNVPSADVLKPRAIYIETDWYVRPWKSPAGRAANTSFRAVAGLVENVEAGINLGAFDLMYESAPFADAAVKWAPEALTSDRMGAYAGSHLGIGLGGELAGRTRSLNYVSLYAVTAERRVRVAIGPYFATRHVFGRSRGGALAGVEAKLERIKGLTLAADWFSGDGGSATPGMIYSAGSFTWYAGYAFANRGRSSDVVALELGFTFHPRRRVLQSAIRSLSWLCGRQGAV